MIISVNGREKKIAALTPDQVVSAMRRHIDPSKITIVKAGDFKSPAAPAPVTTAAASTIGRAGLAQTLDFSGWPMIVRADMPPDPLKPGETLVFVIGWRGSATTMVPASRVAIAR